MKNMPQVRVTVCAAYFYTLHAVAVIFMTGKCFGGEGGKKAGPTCAGVKLGFTGK